MTRQQRRAAERAAKKGQTWQNYDNTAYVNDIRRNGEGQKIWNELRSKMPKEWTDEQCNNVIMDCIADIMNQNRPEDAELRKGFANALNGVYGVGIDTENLQSISVKPGKDKLDINVTDNPDGSGMDIKMAKPNK